MANYYSRGFTWTYSRVKICQLFSNLNHAEFEFVSANKQLEFQQKVQSILDELIDQSRYDWRIPPVNVTKTTGPSPNTINTNLYIRTIDRLDTTEMTWKTQITFRHQWNDPRLIFDDLQGRISYLTLQDEQHIWTPDTFFSNSRHAERMKDIRPNTLIRIYPNGNVLFSTRINLVLSCPMSLTYYPFDLQTCAIQIASCKY